MGRDHGAVRDGAGGGCALPRRCRGGRPGCGRHRYGGPLRPLPRPIAAGYAVAHYFSLLLLDGQTTWILASDPFDKGWDLFGTRDAVVDYTLVSPRVISLVQVFAIVVAHLVGLALAHDRALELDRLGTRPHRPWVAQLPLMLLMVALTSGGLALLLGS